MLEKIPGIIKNFYRCLHSSFPWSRTPDEAEELYRRIYEYLPIPVILFNENGITHINQEMQELTGYAGAELAEKILKLEIIHPEFYRKVKELIPEFINNDRRIYDLDLLIYTGCHSDKWIRCKARTIKSNANQYFLVAAYDISKSKENEAAIFRYSAELDSANRELNAAESKFLVYDKKLRKAENTINQIYADKEGILSVISHGLRTPFHSIIGFAEILLSDIEILSHNEIRKFASHIHESSARLVNFLSSMIEWMELSSGNKVYSPRKLVLEDEIDAVILNLYDSAHHKNILLQRDIMNDLAIYADQQMFALTLHKLISNAIKFTNRNGTIMINAIEEGGYIKIGIHDYGIGISERVLDKLFDFRNPFTSDGTENEKGAGLGLAISRYLVEINKGRIWAESTPGKGSSFYVCLPVYKEKEAGSFLSQAALKYN